MPDTDAAVITVGQETETYLAPLLGRLVDSGLRHCTAGSPADLPALLDGMAKDSRRAILVYSGPGSGVAEQVLEGLAASHPDAPVIVVVNQCNVDEYYELMSQGAYDYFALMEGSGVIETAIRWAAHTHAVPARTAALRSENTGGTAPPAPPSRV